MHSLLWTLVFLAGVGLSSCGDSVRTLRIKGSDTEVNVAVRLAEAYSLEHPQEAISVSGGGSGLGIAALLNGQAEIANSSRPLSEDEKKLFISKGIRYRSFAFALDATAFIVSVHNQIDSLDTSTLSRILSGEASQWKYNSAVNKNITIYGRQSSSGTHSFIRKQLGIEFSPKARELNGNAQILESIRVDESGIGYISAGYLTSGTSGRGIKVLRIQAPNNNKAISPLDSLAIARGEYYFQRPLYQFIPEVAWSQVQAFLTFEQGAAGRRLIRAEGYYPIPFRHAH